jgi:hypothetical protein
MENDRRAPDAEGPFSNGAGGMVEKLLYAAGPGPEIPEDGAARIKDQIRPVWRDVVLGRSRQRGRLWMGGIATAAALIVAAIYLPFLQPGAPTQPPRAVVVAVIDGTLEVTPPGSNVSFLTSESSDSEIPRGSLIRTNSDSRAALWLADRRSLRVDSDTGLRLDSEASVSLVAGGVYIDSSDEVGAGVEVRTALGTAFEIGTQFEVRFGPDRLDVKVREGLVALAREDEEYRITEGVVLSVGSDGGVSTASITPYDPAWTWTEEIAPPFDIEGRSVLAFLDWVSRETGFTIRFADREVERMAASTILHGTIDGLSPAQAPAAILPSARLTATEDAGTLLVRRLLTDEGGF